jgi:hypothetical protein
MMHGRFDEADQVVDSIEQKIMLEDNITSLPEPEGSIMIRPQGTVSFRQIAGTMFKKYTTRSVLALSLMIGQAFMYNAVFFTYALAQTICRSVIFFFASGRSHS